MASADGGTRPEDNSHDDGVPLPVQVPQQETPAKKRQDAQPESFEASLKQLISRHVKAGPGSQVNAQSTTQAMKSLLDAIHVLQDQVDMLGNSFGTDPSQVAPRGPRQPQPDQYLVLHRVFCGEADHCHNKVVYEDQPTYQNDRGWGVDNFLSGNIPIFNVATYLSQRPPVHFVVFREYACSPRHHPGMWQDESQGAHGAEAISTQQERMWIVSQPLHEAISKVAQFRPYNHTPLLARMKEMDAPYHFLFHHHRIIAELAEAESSYRTALAPLLAFLDQNYEADYVEARNMLARGLVSNAHLGKLFQPGRLVAGRHERTGEVTAGVLSDCTLSESGGLLLEGWRWAYDGSHLRREAWNGSVDPLSEEPKPISDLVIYPLDFAHPSVVHHLKVRGRKFWDMRIHRYSVYGDQGDQGTDTRVMVDHSAFAEHARLSGNALDNDIQEDVGAPFKIKPKTPAHHHWDPFDKWPLCISNAENEVPSDMLLVTPNKVPAFKMQRKTWALLPVDELHDVNWDKAAFDHLVLDEDRKALVLSLVLSPVLSPVQAQKAWETETSSDFIRGKGQGLIFLLHGAPGVGKTATAESVAEKVERPLYTLTCGDLATEPESIGRSVHRAFTLASQWNCVVLLDEADVVLEGRKPGDLKRNALVSDFLRYLEYFKGILFLTTNREDQLDEAVRTRIHVSIRYFALTLELRRQLWTNFLRPVMPSLDAYLNELAALNLNGREIRNLVSVAKALARAHGGQIEIDDIRRHVSRLYHRVSPNHYY